MLCVTRFLGFLGVFLLRSDFLVWRFPIVFCVFLLVLNLRRFWIYGVSGSLVFAGLCHLLDLRCFLGSWCFAICGSWVVVFFGFEVLVC